MFPAKRMFLRLRIEAFQARAEKGECRRRHIDKIAAGIGCPGIAGDPLDDLCRLYGIDIGELADPPLLPIPEAPADFDMSQPDPISFEITMVRLTLCHGLSTGDGIWELATKTPVPEG
ncbi:hypothetical protein LZK73_31475 (plasmid) [Neorhizobium galegae]|nr:hypothetical protein LZK73_31475 [Neorhizobium galegae]